jgi:hypothetical protein
MDNMDVEAAVTRYCNAIPHVYPLFPQHSHCFLAPLLIVHFSRGESGS